VHEIKTRQLVVPDGVHHRRIRAVRDGLAEARLPVFWKSASSGLNTASDRAFNPADGSSEPIASPSSLSAGLSGQSAKPFGVSSRSFGMSANSSGLTAGKFDATANSFGLVDWSYIATSKSFGVAANWFDATPSDLARLQE
jgi:hypothetical protein